MRSFIALSITPNSEIQALKEKVEKVKSSRVPKGRELHITLFFLGDITEREKGEICQILSEVRFDSFTLRTTSIDAFPHLERARVAFVGINSPEIGQLHSMLQKRIPEKFKDKREFIPHLTISRFKSPLDLTVLYKENEGKDFGNYEVRSIALFKSDLTPTGAVYTEMCSVQLM